MNIRLEPCATEKTQSGLNRVRSLLIAVLMPFHIAMISSQVLIWNAGLKLKLAQLVFLLLEAIQIVVQLTCLLIKQLQTNI